MQIALTGKLAKAIGIKPAAPDEKAAPLFSWTANWTNTFDDHKEDMIVMVNNATRFTVVIYGIKRPQPDDMAAKMTAAIRNTLRAMNLNPEIVDEYIRRTAWVNRQGLEAAFVVGNIVTSAHGTLEFHDTFGHDVSRRLVNHSLNWEDGYIPAEKMIEALTGLTGKAAYSYRAFVIQAVLDLKIYKATRRLIVPANLALTKLHTVLQRAYGWADYHLYDFSVFQGRSREPVIRFVPDQDSLSWDPLAAPIAGRTLADCFPAYTRLLYTYDMGDDWRHNIKLVRIIEEHNEESPYLLKARGQTPPEDVGGVYGFIDFYNIMQDRNHPEYQEHKQWAGYWSLELPETAARPRVIRPTFWG